MPAIVSSVGFLETGHRDGEAGVARAAGAAGTIQFVSGVTNTPIEEIMAAATGPVFYQLYYIGGREASAPIIERVKARRRIGPRAHRGHADDRRAPARPPLLRAGERPGGDHTTRRDSLRAAGAGQAALAGRLLRAAVREPQVAMGLRPDGTPMGLFEGIEKIYQQTPAWEDIPLDPRALGRAARDQGILTAEDARRAVAEGADAIVVSNHGGNVLDGSVPRSASCRRSSTPSATRSRC